MPLLFCCRLWYVHDYSAKNSLDLPVEVGYMNVIPKCLDSSGKYPVYENLPETYAAINAYLSESPLEGEEDMCKQRGYYILGG